VKVREKDFEIIEVPGRANTARLSDLRHDSGMAGG
jgi:hypothetical protein